MPRLPRENVQHPCLKSPVNLLSWILKRGKKIRWTARWYKSRVGRTEEPILKACQLKELQETKVWKGTESVPAPTYDSRDNKFTTKLWGMPKRHSEIKPLFKKQTSKYTKHTRIHGGSVINVR